MFDKKELRKTVREKISMLDDGYIKDSNAGIYSTVSAMPEFFTAQTVFAYYSTGREVDTLRLIDLALELDKQVALPVTLGDGEMEFALIDTLEAEFDNGSLNIPQPGPDAARVTPQTGDLVLVPGLCYDFAAYRLGQGGGYYDRFLADCAAFTVGLARHRLLMPEVPREIFDLPTKCLVTENGIVKRYRERTASHNGTADGDDCSCGSHEHTHEHDCSSCDLDCDSRREA